MCTYIVKLLPRQYTRRDYSHLNIFTKAFLYVSYTISYTFSEYNNTLSEYDNTFSEYDNTFSEYNNTFSEYDDTFSEGFICCLGVRQGESLSPFMFNVTQ